jgi:uncharacterized protein YkwD
VLRAQTRHAMGLGSARRRVVDGGRWPAILALIALATACGGGDDAGPAKDVATLPAEKPIEQPIVTMPSSTYTGKHLEAFTRINEARIAAGVSALKQSAELDKAAQAHADYLVFNNVLSHGEDASKPMFTGVDSERRAIAQGYKNAMRGEVIARIEPTQSGAEHLAWHLNSVYHLQRVLTPNANEIGVGFKSPAYAADYFTSSISLGVTDARMPSLKDPRVWPVPSALDVPISFRPAEEVPNPLPDVAPNRSVMVGPPVMYCRKVEVTAAWSITSAQIIDSRSQTRIESWLLQQPYLVANALPQVEHRIDPRLGQDGMDCMFLVPKRPLEKGVRYDVSVGTSVRGVVANTAWSFTTAR